MLFSRSKLPHPSRRYFCYSGILFLCILPVIGNTSSMPGRAHKANTEDGQHMVRIAPPRLIILPQSTLRDLLQPFSAAFFIFYFTGNHKNKKVIRSKFLVYLETPIIKVCYVVRIFLNFFPARLNARRAFTRDDLFSTHVLKRSFRV